MEVRLSVSLDLYHRLRLLENYTSLAIECRFLARFEDIFVGLEHSLLFFFYGIKPVVVINFIGLETRDTANDFIIWGIRHSIDPAELLS